MKLFEYVDHRGSGVYSDWYERLEKRQQASLDVKLLAVLAAGEAGSERQGMLPPSLFRGPVRHGGRSYPHTYKLTVGGNVALRPLSCKGPIDVTGEWTLLYPVIEVGGQYPSGCFAEAERRRSEVLADPDGRRREITADDITGQTRGQGIPRGVR